jgi:hypothetical protein
MAKRRESVGWATSSIHSEEKFERVARAIAFEAGAEIIIRGDEVFIVVAEAEEHLCTVDVPKRFWWSVWRAMCQRFPIFERYK